LKFVLFALLTFATIQASAGSIVCRFNPNENKQDGTITIQLPAGIKTSMVVEFKSKMRVTETISASKYEWKPIFKDETESDLLGYRVWYRNPSPATAAVEVKTLILNWFSNAEQTDQIGTLYLERNDETYVYGNVLCNSFE
jgi:hypothetical protein